MTFGTRMNFTADVSEQQSAASSSAERPSYASLLAEAEAPADVSHKQRSEPAAGSEANNGPGYVWPYIQACLISSFVLFSVGMITAAMGRAEGDAVNIETLLGFIIPLSAAPFLAGPAFVLAQVSDAARLPRGYADVGIGTIIGLLLLIALGGSLFEQFMSVIAGMLGGAAFWHAQGFPGLMSAMDRKSDTHPGVA